MKNWELRKKRGSQEPESLPGWVMPFKGNLTRSCPTILTQEEFGRTNHKDHCSNWKNLAKPIGFGDICVLEAQESLNHSPG